MAYTRVSVLMVYHVTSLYHKIRKNVKMHVDMCTCLCTDIHVTNRSRILFQKILHA